MSGNCKDCKWWDPDVAGGWDGQGVCEGADSARADTSEDYVSVGPGEAIVVVWGDYYGAGATLRTGPMFGCVLFEARES